MIGPLTVAARTADSDDIAAGEAIASPGTSASATRPRRATFRKARLRIACPPSCEQLNENANVWNTRHYHSTRLDTSGELSVERAGEQPIPGPRTHTRK